MAGERHDHPLPRARGLVKAGTMVIGFRGIMIHEWRDMGAISMHDLIYNTSYTHVGPICKGNASQDILLQLITTTWSAPPIQRPDTQTINTDAHYHGLRGLTAAFEIHTPICGPDYIMRTHYGSYPTIILIPRTPICFGSGCTASLRPGMVITPLSARRVSPTALGRGAFRASPCPPNKIGIL